MPVSTSVKGPSRIGKLEMLSTNCVKKAARLKRHDSGVPPSIAYFNTVCAEAWRLFIEMEWADLPEMLTSATTNSYLKDWRLFLQSFLQSLGDYNQHAGPHGIGNEVSCTV
jgi:hypothetical protein